MLMEFSKQYTSTDPIQLKTQYFLCNKDGQTQHIGQFKNTAGSILWFDGEMSWVQFVDGLALAPTDFGSKLMRLQGFGKLSRVHMQHQARMDLRYKDGRQIQFRFRYLF